jgi:hypothetical protein
MKIYQTILFLSLAMVFLVSCAVQSETGAGMVVTAQPPGAIVSPVASLEATLPAQLVPTTEKPSEARFGPLCPDPQPPFVTDLAVLAPPSLAEPAPRNPFRDPVFGTCIVRVTDRQADLAPDDPSKGLKNEYSRVESFNADGSYILARSIEAEWYLYDAASLTPLGRLPLGAEPRWDAQDPHMIYFNDETRLMSYNVASGETGLVHEFGEDFADDFPGQSLVAVWTNYEGRPSMDTRYWGLMAEDENWLPVAFVVYDRLADTAIIREMRAVDGIQEDVDNVTISPLGNYYLASFDRYCEHDQLGDEAHPCGLMVYDRDLQNGRSLLRIIGHYDTALDAAGREVVVYQDIDSDQIAMLDLESGQVTPLLPIDFSHTPIGFHFSGLAYDQPGWALVSTYSGGYPEAFTWMDDQVFAIELKAGGRVVHLAHTHSRVDPEMEHDYWAEPHASVNHDFTRVLFTSNWGRSGSEQVEMYLIELPPEWMANLPSAP